MQGQTIKINTVQELVRIIADEAERQGADGNDSQGIVRAIVTRGLPERTSIHWDVWFLVCCELGDRSARAAGFDNQVQRAATIARERIQ